MSMSNIDMVDAVRMLAADRGIPVDTLLQVLADALVTAYKRRPDAADEAEVQIDAETMDIRIFAYDIDEYGDLVNRRDDTPDDMGRIAAQTFRQVLSQRIREVERDRKFEEYANREGDIVIRSRRFQAFAWETKVEGRVKQRDDKDDVSITINYTFNPTPLGIVLGVLFIPIGAILFMMGMNAKQELQRNLRRALEDAEESLTDRG